MKSRPLRPLALYIPLILLGISCSSDTEGQAMKQAQPPVVVVQAPTEKAAAGTEAASYAGLAWEAAAKDGAAEGGVGDAVEPYDVVSLLREFEPSIVDSPKDQDGDNGYDDLLSALVVADDSFLYGRVVSRVPMRGFYTREVRFWIEQPPEMTTVEIKVGTRGRPCEVAHVKSPDAQKVIKGCFWLGNALDFRIPLDSFPASFDVKKPMWASGFQTCCSDPERNKFLDEIDQAQEVWRVAGEVEAKPD